MRKFPIFTLPQVIVGGQMSEISLQLTPPVILDALKIFTGINIIIDELHPADAQPLMHEISPSSKSYQRKLKSHVNKAHAKIDFEFAKFTCVVNAIPERLEGGGESVQPLLSIAVSRLGAAVAVNENDVHFRGTVEKIEVCNLFAPANTMQLPPDHEFNKYLVLCSSREFLGTEPNLEDGSENFLTVSFDWLNSDSNSFYQLSEDARIMNKVNLSINHVAVFANQPVIAGLMQHATDIVALFIPVIGEYVMISNKVATMQERQEHASIMYHPLVPTSSTSSQHPTGPGHLTASDQSNECFTMLQLVIETRKVRASLLFDDLACYEATISAFSCDLKMETPLDLVLALRLSDLDFLLMDFDADARTFSAAKNKWGRLIYQDSLRRREKGADTSPLVALNLSIARGEADVDLTTNSLAYVHRQALLHEALGFVQSIRPALTNIIFLIEPFSQPAPSEQQPSLKQIEGAPLSPGNKFEIEPKTIHEPLQEQRADQPASEDLRPIRRPSVDFHGIETVGFVPSLSRKSLSKGSASTTASTSTTAPTEPTTASVATSATTASSRSPTIATFLSKPVSNGSDNNLFYTTFPSLKISVGSLSFYLPLDYDNAEEYLSFSIAATTLSTETHRAVKGKSNTNSLTYDAKMVLNMKARFREKGGSDSELIETHVLDDVVMSVRAQMASEGVDAEEVKININFAIEKIDLNLSTRLLSFCFGIAKNQFLNAAVTTSGVLTTSATSEQLLATHSKKIAPRPTSPTKTIEVQSTTTTEKKILFISTIDIAFFMKTFLISFFVAQSDKSSVHVITCAAPSIRTAVGVALDRAGKSEGVKVNVFIEEDILIATTSTATADTSTIQQYEAASKFRATHLVNIARRSLNQQPASVVANVSIDRDENVLCEIAVGVISLTPKYILFKCALNLKSEVERGLKDLFSSKQKETISALSSAISEFSPGEGRAYSSFILLCLF
jgi:hypothetical protein